MGRKSYQKRSLLSLIGKLSHACKVVLAGRLFLRRMIEQAKTARRLNHWVHLTAEFHSDLRWWQTFLEYWNGCSMIQVHCRRQPPDIGAWGCGASWGNQWLQCQWVSSWKSDSIAAKELLPIVLAVVVWGHQWHHQQVLVLCNNMVVVQVLNSQWCQDQLYALHYWMLE